MAAPIQAADAEKATAQLEQQFNQLSFDEPLKECAQELRQGMAENFASKTDAKGNAWPARKNPGDGHPLLIDTGALLLGVTSPGSSDHVENIASNELMIGVTREIQGVPKAVALNFGFEKNNLPARQFIYGRADRVDKCGELIADFAMDLFDI